MTYEAVATFAQQGGTLFFMALFLAGVVYALLPAKTARLSKKLAQLLPSIDPRPEFAWTGSFGTTRTGLPLIGKLPRHPRVHAVLGYGGNGITFSRMAAEIVRADLTGATDADATLFAFES